MSIIFLKVAVLFFLLSIWLNTYTKEKREQFKAAVIELKEKFEKYATPVNISILLFLLLCIVVGFGVLILLLIIFPLLTLILLLLI